MIKFIALLLILNIVPTYAQFVDKPTWHDEFNGKQLDTIIWKRSVTNPTKQLSCYCNDIENAFTKKGKLHLKLLKTNDNKKPYKSGRVETKLNYGIGYGKLEIRAKANTSKGVWPALWLRPYPTEKKSIKGEIDILEYIDCWNDSLIQVNYHLWGNFRGKTNNHIQYPQKIKCNVSKWHIYTYELYPNYLIVRIDDKIVYRINKGEKGEEWPFGYKYQLLIAYAYGGWGGTCGIDDSALPSEFIIDYVRYYKIKE